ncbi:AAA family ATPase [Clostridium kluyveri]|uniref:Cytidylate kinase n=1 Tax=Clostridium kluyveri TaxID=1534 RepID=A0A1L5F9N0_CLOKL|nr:cytidylate kinase-like family protein [Clostridium kluyveri]APM39530.1 cytidylate kinase [Clostridium kluyveri]
MDKYYITINRQFGSLGRPIAREISSTLGIEYYDRDIVEATSRKLNLPVSTISRHEETSFKSNFFNMLFPLGDSSKNNQDKIFDAERQIILNLADKESCIIVGRCADFILRDHKNCMNIFIYAPKEARFENCVKILKMESEEARKMIAEVDKARDNYYRNYAGYSLEDIKHKHIMIDSSLLGVHGTAEILVEIIKKRFETS